MAVSYKKPVHQTLGRVASAGAQGQRDTEDHPENLD